MSQTPHKPLQKMCKSPKNSTYQTIKHEKIEYENLSTNCTVVGSNNLNLVKKPQIVTSVSPAYSNPSPVYPPSPYSSPASLKSPSPSLKPPTPQPNFPVMQIIQNNILARPIQASQPQNIIKLKPHLNILPKPSASPQPSPKPSISPQIVIPTNHQQTATIVPTAQPLLLNQMPMLTTPSVQFILRPQQTTKLQPQVQTATATPQGLILQPGGQQLLQIQQPRSQPMVRVLTNGMQLTPTTTTYVTQVGTQQPNSASHLTQQTLMNNTQAHHVVQHHQHQQMKKKPKNKVKKKLDLANIMKLSGIGDEDDIQFESDTSQSESEHNSVPTTPQPQHVHSTVQAQTNFVHTDTKKNIQNIQISAMTQPTINAATPVVQVLNQNFQSGMISNSTSQAGTAQASIPFNSFITPNYTINNGLMLQRSGGFKLTMGEDGRLILQHDPTLNSDIQSQIILQSLLGGLVLQPSMDQQTVQQTVQTIQQQSVQTIQQQTVQSQTIQTVQQQTVQPQTVQHTIQSLQPQIQQQTVQQTIQHQTVNALQQPMQIVQPQPIQSIHSQAQPIHSISQSQVHSLQSQIQGQLQSLLQQQNHHTVQHSNVPTQNVHSQTVQSVQNVQSMQQNLQNLQQNVQSVQQNIQSVQQNVRSVQQNVQSLQQNIQSIPQSTAQTFHTNHSHAQNQPVLKVQPFQKSQPPVQTVQPIQHHISNQSQQQQQHLRENHNSGQPPPASYVVNLTPDQLEQLKRNGQLTVNGQTIFMQRPNKDQLDKKISPKSKNTKKVNKIQSIKNILHESENEPVKASNNSDPIKENVNKSVDSALNAPPKQILPQNHVQPQPLQQTKALQPHALVQPSVQVQPKTIPDRSKSIAIPAVSHIPKQQKVAPTIISQDSNGIAANPDVDKILVQILEESNMNNVPNSTTTATPPPAQPHQRITTIQLTPQKQQQLKNIQHQIQSLSARLTPGDLELQNTLKMLFTEQQKILASGKLLPLDKVHYHNNQLTIMNPSALNLSPSTPVKNEKIETPNFLPVLSNSQNASRSSSIETQATTRYQPITTPAHSAARISVSVPCSETTATQTIHHLPSPIPQNNHQTTPHFTHITHAVSSHSAAVHQIPAISLSTLHSISSHPNITTPHQSVKTHQHQPQHAAHGTISSSTDAHVQNHLPASHCPSGIHPSTNHNVVSSHQVTNHQTPSNSANGLHQNHLQVTTHYNHIVSPRFNCPQPLQQISIQQQQMQRQQLMHKKANIIETQLSMDQTGATKPDIHTPFRTKKDACIRLIRYHCLDQPVLSEKDLDKADEIFELTAQHFIGKFSRMEDKYKYLLMKESMRQVQTSELMMLDRMFLTDEQQSLIKLRQDYENELLNIPSSTEQEMPHSLPPPPPQPPPVTHTSQSTSIQNVSTSEPSSCEDYDEWACIQRELGCLPHHIESKLSQHNHPKRSASTDSRLETLKRFRVDKHHKKTIDGGSGVGNSAPSTIYTKVSSGCSSAYDSAQNCSFSSHEDNEPENNSIDEQVQSAIDSILNLQQTPSLDLDSILS